MYNVAKAVLFSSRVEGIGSAVRGSVHRRPNGPTAAAASAGPSYPIQQFDDLEVFPRVGTVSDERVADMTAACSSQSARTSSLVSYCRSSLNSI